MHQCPTLSTWLLFLSVSMLTVLLWSIFNPPQRKFAVRSLLFQPAWILRIYLQDTTWKQDIVGLIFLHAAYSHFTGTWCFPTPNALRRIDLDDSNLLIYIDIFALLGTFVLLAGLIARRDNSRRIDVERDAHSKEQIDEQLLPPLLIKSRTTHSRIFPKPHSFSYSYLLVGIPVGIHGRISNALSVDSHKRRWFHVDSHDYLLRSKHRLRLSDKLRQYLQGQGIIDWEYSFAYLVTAPAFLGYSFNPASFWYIYDSETVLKYMIIEVNNTFDERRLYLLRAGDAQNLDAKSEDGAEQKNSLLFTNTWQKDFHVSPFNSVKGSYSLKAVDPLAAYQKTGQVHIDNTIVLRSSKLSAKIVARVFSHGTPQDATTITLPQLYRFIFGWWWVGFATSPRIIWEAGRLFWKRKLHVFLRPEVAETSMGREYAHDEEVIEELFRHFMKDIVAHTEVSIRLIYSPAHGHGEDLTICSPRFTREKDDDRTLKLNVLSPAFYSRYLHYAHAKKAFDRECLATNEKNRTVIVDNAHLLPIFLQGMHGRRKAYLSKLSALEQLRWSIMKRLRCPPPAQSYPSDSRRDSDYHVPDIRPFGASELEDFVQRRSDDAVRYRRVATKLFLAERFAFGASTLVSAIDWLLRMSMLLVAIWGCDYIERPVDILRPRPWDVGDPVPLMTMIGLANGVHWWSFVKG